MADFDVRIVYGDRDRRIPARIQRTRETETTHWGVPLVGFWAPNNYAVRPGDFSFFLTDFALTSLEAVNNALVDSGGGCIVLVDAYRTYEKQLEAWQDKPHLAIHPDDSKHTKGLAVDLRLYSPKIGVFDEAKTQTYGDQDLLAAAMLLGQWKRTVLPKEPWHFDYLGGAR